MCIAAGSSLPLRRAVGGHAAGLDEKAEGRAAPAYLHLEDVRTGDSRGASASYTARSQALSAQDKQCLQQSLDRLQNALKVKDPLGFLTSEGTARLCCGSRGTAQTYTYWRTGDSHSNRSLPDLGQGSTAHLLCCVCGQRSLPPPTVCAACPQ